MRVRFSKKYFNPLYFIIKDILKDKTIRTVLIYGGKSSSKTVSICQALIKDSIVGNASTVALRKESTSIPTTLKKSFSLAIDSMYLYPAFLKQDRRFLCDNGSEVVLKGIDSEEKAKGVESYKYLFLDELNHFEQGEYEQFQLSLRGIEGQKIFAAWNPVDENSWVKTELVDKHEWVDTEWKLPCEHSFVKKSANGKIILIKTTYEDNYWIAGHPTGEYGYRDENLIAEYNAMKNTNYNKYRVNVLGEWGKVTYGGEFLKSWRSEQHTGSYPYQQDLAIYLSFDENVNPYFPVGFFQVGEDGLSPRLIHSIAAENPNNTVKWICREISRKLKEWGHRGKLYVGGDATSKKEDVKIEKGHDLFRLIINELWEFNPERRLSTSNPSVIISGQFFNSLLDGNINGITFGADNSNRKAIQDYENAKEDKNGHIDKKTVTNPITKVSYQPFGHFVDLTRYFLVNTYSAEYAKFQSGGLYSTQSIGKNIWNESKKY